MKPYKITESDYQIIKNFAHKQWLERPSKEDGIMCECYTAAVFIWINKKKIIIKDGRLYEKE